MQNLLNNWKTSSAGLTIIIGAVVHLVFAVIHGTADETVWTTSLLAIITGIGLIVAGDASKSATKEEVQTVAAKTEAVKTAVLTNDTALLKKTDVDNTPPPTDLKKP